MKNIVLIGPSGIGKTTVGNYISKELGIVHIDTDKLIEETCDMKIKKIFEVYGESYFRNIESKIVERVVKERGIVISTGGGIILKKENIQKLKSSGIIFLLHGKVETIVKNLNFSKEERPLISNAKDTYKRVKTMYQERKKLYFTSADYVIKVDEKSIENIGKEIIFIYRKH